MMPEIEQRRAPMQSEFKYTDKARAVVKDAVPAGTVAWSEHEEIWEAYANRFGRDQSAERIADRGGFGYWEATRLLGREPTTWRRHTL